MGNSAIRAYKYTPEDVKCEYCTEYRKRRCGAVHGCPWLAERVEAGVVGYKEAVMETFSYYTLFSYRLNSAIQRFNGSLWRDSEHERRMTYQKAAFGFRRKRDTPTYYAALYLLTATKGLCDRTRDCFHKTGIDFRRAKLRGVTPHEYTLFMAAKGIYGGKIGITQEDMANPEIIDSAAFGLIVNALLIARFGSGAFSIRDRSMLEER